MWRRALRIIVITAVALQASYLLVANTLLMTPLLRWMVPQLAQGKVHLDWTSAWTVWWGHVHVNGFSMQFDDGHAAQIDLRVGHATTDVAIGAIAERRFLLEHVRAHGVTFRMAAKVTEETVRAFPRRIAAFPPVPGYPSVAQEPYRPWAPRGPGTIERLWAFELRDITAEAEELWIDELRYRGKIHAAGGFDLEPRRKLWVDAAAELEPGLFTAGPHVISRDLGLVVQGRIAEVPLDPDRPELIARATTATLHANAGLVGLELVSLYADDASARAGAGRLSVNVALEDGRFSRDSTIDATFGGLDGTVGGADLAGQADVAAEVDDRGKIVAHLTAAGTAVFPAIGGVRLRADTGPVEATVQLMTADLAEGLGFEELSAAAGRVRLTEAPELAHTVFLFSKLTFAEGPATASVTVRVTPEAVRVRLLDARLGNATASGAAVYAEREWRGAAELRLGHLLFGARFRGDALHPQLFPRDNWLESQLEALGFRPSGS